MKAFVLIALSACDEKKFLEDLKTHKEIKEAFVLFGEWDILAQIEMENAEQLGTFIMDKIRSQDCVKLTSSMIVAGQ